MNSMISPRLILITEQENETKSRVNLEESSKENSKFYVHFESQQSSILGLLYLIDDVQL